MSGNKFAEEAIQVARIAMFMIYPFWGNMASRLHIVEDSTMPTLATNGRRVYYNPEYVCTLTPGQLIFALAHEVLHAMLDHIGRSKGNYNHKLANIAQDLAVNDILTQEKVGSRHENWLYDSQFTNMAWEEIYEILVKNADSLDIDDLLGGMVDSHIEKGSDDSGSMTEEEANTLRDEIRAAVIAASSLTGPGKTPACAKRMVGALMEPQINWRDLLQQQIESQIKGDYTFMRPSRRSWHMDAVLPRQMTEKTVDVFLAIDTSGSIGSRQIADFFSEVKGIVDQYQSYTIHMCCWDTKVYNYQSFTEEDSDDIFDYKASGGGGTSAKCVFDFLKASDIVPRQLVFFTDGMIDQWGDPDYCNTTWIVHGRDTCNPPFGSVVQYDR